MCDAEHIYPLTGGRFCGKIESMAQRVIAALVVVALVLGLLEAVPGWVPNIALVVLGTMVVWQYVSRVRGRNAAR
jgi:hypothetical protein